MPHPGERPSHRRWIGVPAAAVLVVLGITFLVGAAAPAAVRVLLPPPSVSMPTLQEVRGDGSPGAENVAAVERTPAALLPEALRRTELPTRAERPAQTAETAAVAPARGERALAPPTLRPSDRSWTARRLEIPALGVDVAVAMAGSTADELFPPYGGAYILRSSAQPGRGTNSYMFAHAVPHLFLPLWWAQSGQQVIVTMSDGQELGYRVSAVVRDIPCPDPAAHRPQNLPPALANATECDISWTLPTSTERLTLQTSQGFNRNYGEMVVIAEPDW